MKEKGSNLAKIEREMGDLGALLGTLPENPIPWTTLITLVAPLVARLGARFALKRAKRSLSEEKVNAIGKAVGDFISAIIASRIPPTA